MAFLTIEQRIPSFLEESFTGIKQNVLKEAKKRYGLIEELVVTMFFSTKVTLFKKLG